jgi:hypothetical protein
MLANGLMGSSMGEAPSLPSMDNRETESGIMGRESDGLMIV